MATTESSLSHTVRAWQDWISSATLSVIEQRCIAHMDNKTEEYHQFEKQRKQALRRDKEQCRKGCRGIPTGQQHEGCFSELPSTDTPWTKHIHTNHNQIWSSGLSDKWLLSKDGKSTSIKYLRSQYFSLRPNLL